MEFRNLKRQYQRLKSDIDDSIQSVLNCGQFISGPQVADLERQLAEYVGVNYCITCGNGTDALSLALMAWGIGNGDAVFVPDFTFFASGETVALTGATPIFIDIEEDTFNISSESLEEAIQNVLEEAILTPKAIITVDLFGQPADYDRITPIARKYGLKILEDGAQGLGGSIRNKMACSFGDIGTTSFFPAKPVGCYGDGGAVFTNDDETADVLFSLRIHGKGKDKYDNIRIGMNSRLDTIQAAILKVKLNAFVKVELDNINCIAMRYSELLNGVVKTPTIQENFISSWAQYSILLKDKKTRDGLQLYLKNLDIPSIIYYRKPMHQQEAFLGVDCVKTCLAKTEDVCNRILSLPIYPYMKKEEQDRVVQAIFEFIK